MPTIGVIEDGHRELLGSLFPCLDVALPNGSIEGAVVRGASLAAAGILGAFSPDDLVGLPLADLFGPAVARETVLTIGRDLPAAITDAFVTTLAGDRVAVIARAAEAPEGGVTLAFALTQGVEALRSELEITKSRARKLFDDIPTALWQIDGRFSFEMFRRLKREGVTDIGAYFDAHPEVITQALEATIVVDANAQAVQKFGRGVAEELRIPVAHYWKGAEDAFRRLLTAKFNGRYDHVEEVRMQTLDGTYLDVLFTMTFPPTVEPESYSLINMIDVSDRVRAETEIRRLQAEFAHASRLSLLGELTASIAHEINQPLSAMATNGDAAMRWLNRPEPNLAQTVSRVTRIVEDARRASDVVQRMRTLAQPQARQHAAISINDNAREAARLVRHQSMSRGVEILVDLDKGLPLVLGDPIQIQQVIANLVINAIQAIDAGPDAGARWVRITSCEVGDGWIELSVADSGPGIDPANLGCVFDGFFTTKPDGMGMGLAISRTIVAAHKGELLAHNADGAGAVITLRLPATA